MNINPIATTDPITLRRLVVRVLELEERVAVLEKGVKKVTIYPHTKINDAGFTARTANAIQDARVMTIGGLLRMPDIKIRGIKGLGEKGYREVINTLEHVIYKEDEV